MIENEHPYQVDGEIGRFAFTTHSIFVDDCIVFDTSKNTFFQLKGKEWYRTTGFKELAIVYGSTEKSYRKSSELINRVRHQKGATPSRTLRDNTESEGRKLSECIDAKTRKILQEKGFSYDGVPDEVTNPLQQQSPSTLCAVQIEQAIEKCMKQSGLSCESGEIEKNPVLYEDPDQSVNVSIDDVSVKRQKEEREHTKADDTDERKYFHNTIAHVENGGRTYVLNAHGTGNCLRILLAFLINNDLLKYRIQFFTDGHTTLVSTIQSFLSWHLNIGLILDWYHLEKKCKEQLSRAMNSRIARNETLSGITHLLWYGLVDRAIKSLQEIDDSSIKNEQAIEKLIQYLERNRPNIPCYAARKELCLRNSSNKGEKANDLVVSDRQKHNGMSWSKSGSLALASMGALVRNGEHTRWFESGDVAFKFAA